MPNQIVNDFSIDAIKDDFLPPGASSKKDDTRNSLDNYLQSVLRKDYSSESLQTPEQEEDCKRLLVQKAIDHDIELGDKKSEEEYNKLAEEAISKFKKLWNNKQHGEDNRGTTSLGRLVSYVSEAF